jgi:hypothetical protein
MCYKVCVHETWLIWEGSGDYVKSVYTTFMLVTPLKFLV